MFEIIINIYGTYIKLIITLFGTSDFVHTLLFEVVFYLTNIKASHIPKLFSLSIRRKRRKLRIETKTRLDYITRGSNSIEKV